MYFKLIALFAVSVSCFAAVPFGRETRIGAVMVDTAIIGSAVPGVPNVPGARAGVMVSLKDGLASTTRYVVTVEVRLTEGRTVSQTEIVKRPQSSSEYTSVVFLVGQVSQILSITVEELSRASLTKVTD